MSINTPGDKESMDCSHTIQWVFSDTKFVSSRANRAADDSIQDKKCIQVTNKFGKSSSTGQFDKNAVDQSCIIDDSKIKITNALIHLAKLDGVTIEDLTVDRDLFSGIDGPSELAGSSISNNSSNLGSNEAQKASNITNDSTSGLNNSRGVNASIAAGLEG